MVFGLLIMIAVRGMSHFWPAQVLEFDYTIAGKFSQRIAGEINDTVEVSLENLRNSRSEERRVGKECRSRWSTYH